MTRLAVRAVGAYAPPYRLPADAVAAAWGRFEAPGIDRTAVPGADEDALTMAVAAARRALAATGAGSGDEAGGGARADGGSGDEAGERAGSTRPVAGADLEYVAFATTTPPQEEGDLTARLGAALGVPDGATRHSFGASTRAGTRALAAAADAAPDPGLVVAADCPRGEPADARDHAAGAGAAAFVLGGEGPATLVGRAEYADPTPGVRHRRRGSDRVEGLGITGYDRAAFARAAGGAVEGLEPPPEWPADPAGAVDAAAIQSPDGAAPYRVADALGVARGAVAATATVGDLGDTGAASVPLSLARAFAAGGVEGDAAGGETGAGDPDATEDPARVLAVGYGGGVAADALLFAVEGPVPAALDLGPDLDADADADADEGPGDAEDDRILDYAAALRLRGEVTPPPPAGGGAHVSVPAWKRSLPGRYRPGAARCPACGALSAPPEGACPACDALADGDRVPVGPGGVVEAVTEIGHGGAPPEFADQQARSGAYGVAIVALDGPGAGETASLPLQVADGHRTPGVGDRVRTVLRRVYTEEGVTRYGVKAVPETAGGPRTADGPSGPTDGGDGDR